MMINDIYVIIDNESNTKVYGTNDKNMAIKKCKELISQYGRNFTLVNNLKEIKDGNKTS